MRCIMCGAHATFTHTLFTGTTPHKVNLCDPCAQRSEANDHMAKIKAAPDKVAKGAAVESFLKVLDEGKNDAPEARA